MSRFRAWAFAVAFGSAAGAAAPVSAADAPDSRPWYKKLFVSAPPSPGPTVRTGPVTPARAPGAATLSPDMVREAAQAEAAALMRRMEVCLKLREVAFDKNDDALMRQVDELERQAQTVYEARLAALGVSKGARAPLPAPTTATAARLDPVPQKSLDPKASAARLIAPAAPVPVSGTASAAPTVPPASDIREVKP